jgi:hypothetical protein
MTWHYSEDLLIPFRSHATPGPRAAQVWVMAYSAARSLVCLSVLCLRLFDLCKQVLGCIYVRLGGGRGGGVMFKCQQIGSREGLYGNTPTGVGPCHPYLRYATSARPLSSTILFCGLVVKTCLSTHRHRLIPFPLLVHMCLDRVGSCNRL